MTPAEVKEYFKTGYGLYKQTGMAHSNMYLWEKKGYVPVKAQAFLEHFTQGKLKANYGDIKCRKN